jgi:hypothetical protein
LVLDNFAIKHTQKEDAAQHLLATLKKMHVCTTNWTVERCCGLTLAWDHAERTCEISMPGCIERTVQRFQHFQHAPPRRPEHSPHAWQKPTCGAKTQHDPPPDTSTPLNAANLKRVQEVLGTFLCCACAVDSTMLLAAIGAPLHPNKAKAPMPP